MTDRTKIAVALFNKLANVYEEKFMDVTLYHDTLDVFCNEIEKKNASLLEIACGPGNITKHLFEKRPDFKILGTDLAPNMLALAKKNNPLVTFQQLDAKNIFSLNESFDGIMCGFGFPYLSKEEAIRLIQDSYKILNANGVLYLSTMEDNYSKSGWQKGSSGDEIFMYYHQEDYLVDALKNSGFSLVEIQRKAYTSNDKSMVTDLILIAKK